MDGRPILNHILLSLPENEFQTLRPSLSFVELPHHSILHESGEKMDSLYFPNQGLVSFVVATREGKTVEVGVVGSEGVVGTPILVGLFRSPHRAVVQISGDGFRLKAEALSGLHANSHLQLQAGRHAVIQGMQAAQSAACNRLHGIEQRLARWLLVMQDRVNNGALFITHDFLAAMLGTDRPSVSLAAGNLQRKGLIGYTRGAIRIENRSQLEEAACECYQVMHQMESWALGPYPSTSPAPIPLPSNR